jgi:hypothetical protein
MTRGSELFAVELTPKIVTIKFKSGRTSTDSEIEMYKLSLPFIQVYVSIGKAGGSINETRLSCTKLPVETLDQPVFILPLPNQHDHGNGNVCTGDIRISNELPTNKKVKNLIEKFFTSAFNTDLTTDYPESLKFKVNETATLVGIAGWSKHTENNAMFGISDIVQYTPHRYMNVAGIMKHMTTEFDNHLT